MQYRKSVVNGAQEMYVDNITLVPHEFSSGVR